MARRFKSQDDVRRYLATLINRLEKDKVKPEMAGRCAYIANILLRAIEGSDLERRIEALESRLTEGGE
ncbi:MAG: hypothetical protein JRI34_07785 [Deltaproteobacteria bacterium]|nr:hypothetical protein [Deltaproteobacteria bacterium]